MGPPTVVLFTRDLRLADHPALAAAVSGARSPTGDAGPTRAGAGGGPVVPLFVLDPDVLRRAGPNRAAFLVDALEDLREGLRRRGGDRARHFSRWLVDADVAANAGNWQWVAGTGNDTRPNRTVNPARQAARYDPDGEYRRRWL